MSTTALFRVACTRELPEFQVFLLDEWRDVRRNNVESHWNVFFGRAFGL